MAFDIEFTRTFKHLPWTDNVDRVTAGGDNGFNVRFQALEADLDTLHDRFLKVTAALNSLASGAGSDRVITVSPLFVSTAGNPWDLSTVGIARKLAASSDAIGAVQVALPAAGVVSSLTVSGTNVGTGQLTVQLVARDTQGTAKTIAEVDITGTASTTPFTVTQPANPNSIDPASSYFILAEGASRTTTDSITITGLQIACKAA